MTESSPAGGAPVAGLLVPPAPQLLDRPSAIRWAVGTEQGPRSNTWSVVGQGNADDVFIGLREYMGKQKLSLHRVKWRMAYTREAAIEMGLPEGVDRVVTRWEKPDDMTPGWKRAATIVIPTSGLGPGYPEKPVKRGGSVAWFPAPRDGWALQFTVLLGEADAGALTITDGIGEVGRMTLSGGTRVWVLADEIDIRGEREESLSEKRRAAAAMVPEGTEVRGWAWGSVDEDGTPFLLDVSGLVGTAVSPPDGDAPGAPSPV